MSQFYNAWKPLTKKEFDIEWNTENIVFYFTSAYNSKELENSWRDIMFDMLPKISSVKTIKKEQLNPRSPDYYVAEGLEDLKNKIAYMQPPKDVFGLARAFRTNSPLFMPMIIQDGDTYKTIGGRTRMSVAFIMDYPVKAIVIDKTKFRNLVILPIKRAKYLSSDTFFTHSSKTRQALLDYVDGEISLEELKRDKELSIITNDELKFEIDMARRHSFKPELKKNPTMKTTETKLLATAPSLDKIKEMIAKYWCTKPEKITLVQKSDSLWSIYQIGDIDYLDKMKRLHENGLIKMDENFVELKKGRYRFVYSPLVKSNPRRLKNPYLYGLNARPLQGGAQPKGWIEYIEKHPDFRHGALVYENELSDHEVDSFEMVPSGEKHIEKVMTAFIKKLGKYKDQVLSDEDYLDDQLSSFFSDNGYSYRLSSTDMKKFRNELTRIKPNPIKVKKGPREYGTRSGHKLNLAQALEIRSNDYRTRDAQHDYDPSSVDERIYELQARKSEREIPRAIKERFVEHKPIKIKIPWQDYESLSHSYAYLELPDYPFYNVKIMRDGDGFAVVSGTGTKIEDIKHFSNLKISVSYAEAKFTVMVQDDKHYIVTIMD